MSHLCMLWTLLAATCILVAAGQDIAEIPVEKDKPYVHQPSGFVFPATVAGFDRVSVRRYEDDGKNISVGYNQRPSLIVMTVFVYHSRADLCSGSHNTTCPRLAPCS